MSGVEHAREMLTLAQRDFKALQSMLDADTFADEIFGFHAQQTVEKALKAWLTLLLEHLGRKASRRMQLGRNLSFELDRSNQWKTLARQRCQRQTGENAL